MEPRAMRVGFARLSVLTAIAVFPYALAAQQPPPMPPGPAALSVPHPIPPVPTSPGPPRDLYQQLTPPQPPPTVYIPGVVYGPYGAYAPWMYLGSGYMNPWPAP